MLKNANLEETVTNVISAAFGSAGERCMACAVVTIEEDIADEFIAMLRERQRQRRFLYEKKVVTARYPKPAFE